MPSEFSHQKRRKTKWPPGVRREKLRNLLHGGGSHHSLVGVQKALERGTLMDRKVKRKAKEGVVGEGSN